MGRWSASATPCSSASSGTKPVPPDSAHTHESRKGEAPHAHKHTLTHAHTHTHIMIKNLPPNTENVAPSTVCLHHLKLSAPNSRVLRRMLEFLLRRLRLCTDFRTMVQNFSIRCNISCIRWPCKKNLPPNTEYATPNTERLHHLWQ